MYMCSYIMNIRVAFALSEMKPQECMTCETLVEFISACLITSVVLSILIYLFILGEGVEFNVLEKSSIVIEILVALWVV